MTGWELRYDGFDPREEGRREALCALGNGYFATRAAAPESTADNVHYPGTYAAGCYNRLTDRLAGESVENESLVNLPNWLFLTFSVDGGDWFDLGNVDILAYRQELDLRRGVLTRVVRFRDAAHRTSRLAHRCFVHMALPHVAGLEATITAEDWSGSLRVRSGLDGTVQNTGVARYRSLASRHFRVVAAEPVDLDMIRLIVETSQSHIRIAEAARTRVSHNGAPFPRPTVIREPGRIFQELAVHVERGDDVTVEKVVTLYTSRDRAISEPAAAAIDWLRRLGTFDELLERHACAWGQLWQCFRLDFDADPDALTAIHLHLFHLLQTVSANSVDLDVGVPARALHGEAYRGHVFWDEVFVVPILTLRIPALTRALLLYRYRRLPAARRSAREAGFAGAMYPWQSGSDGREENQQFHLNPISGRWVSDPTHLQRHIGIAVAYNTWRYYEATGDRQFLVDYGAEMLFEIARFWASIATYDAGRGRYVIRGVMGPDEFHTGYPKADNPGIDNNAYTNVMAAWVLLRALDALRVLPNRRRDELAELLDLRPAEFERWEQISCQMFVPFHGDGIISQFEGYERLRELDWDCYRSRYGDIQRLDRILEAEGETANDYKGSKQADVLMLLYLLSADELRALFDRLGYALPPESIPANIDYYTARTSHGSTLSAVVHAWVLARANRAQAMEYFTLALRSDTADIQGGTTAEGIHLGAMAGSIDLLQRCFTGLEVRGDTLWLNPCWPKELGALEFDICYRGLPLTLRFTANQVRVSAGREQAAPVRIGYRAEVFTVSSGETVEIAYQPGASAVSRKD